MLDLPDELLENAIKFTPEGGSIELRVADLPDADAVSIVVADSGIGMRSEQLVNIFRPFAQGDQSLARRFVGLGLGLAYVHEMVTRRRPPPPDPFREARPFREALSRASGDVHPPARTGATPAPWPA